MVAGYCTLAGVDITTADGERLYAEHLPGPRGPHGVAVVLAHGFTGHLGKPALWRIAEALARTAGVVAYDARGHGRSSGLSTLGDREVLDVDAAVATARGLGYDTVVTCGWSMGGAAVVRHAALRGSDVAGHLLLHPPDAVVSVSATSRWFVRNTRPMRLLHLAVETRLGRAVARRRLGTRVSPAGWDPLPVSPVECVGAVAPLPLLIVHGDADGYFPVEHPQALLAAAGQPTELWLEPGFGHAEEAAGAELLERLARRVGELVSC